MVYFHYYCGPVLKKIFLGPTGAGKSENLKVLAKSLSTLNNNGVSGKLYQQIRQYVMNPKSITMGQLYGEFDPNTREFIDGVLPNLYRQASEDTSPDCKWVVFDGPVDAIWVSCCSGTWHRGPMNGED